MAVLYLTEPRTTLRLRSESLLVTREAKAETGCPRHEELLQVPAHRLEAVALVGDVHITSDATHFCLDRGVIVTWLTASGRLRGRLVPPQPRAGDLRLIQFTRWHADPGRLDYARRLVAAKLHNAARVLTDVFAHYSETAPVVDAKEILAGVASRAATAESRQTLFGLEGMGARAYFQALTAAFRSDITFAGRAQDPPPDPANALLSLAYVLLGNRLAYLLEARGLDPALGFYHDVRPGRASLALDLLEEFRHAVVDRFVIRACNLRILRPCMFERDIERPGGVRLGREGLRLFFAEWEKYLQRPLRDADESEPLSVLGLLRRQVDRLIADLRGGPDYRPVRYGD